MLFHTWPFAFFFIIVYLVYLPLRRSRFWPHWLLAASYFFYWQFNPYRWWNPLYPVILAYITIVTYYAGKLIQKSAKRKIWLAVVVVNNLLVLGFFKYSPFTVRNLNAVLSISGTSYQLPIPDIIFPVGISFYTFQAVSYIIDLYRGRVEKDTGFFRFALYVSMFPRLMAGPIERAGNLLPQLVKKPDISRENITDGLSLFVVGLFKKLAVADYLGIYVDKIYSAPDMFDGLTLMLASFAYCWQVYMDFSGYSDMARGLARMMGFDLMLNFNNPYLATGLGDFWSRWHISLSSWFRDYLYIPLGGNRKGAFNTYRNMFITMVVSGLWHGPAWTFVIWGALHAFGRFMTRELERTEFYVKKVPRLLKQIMVFIFVTFAWIFFRADSLGDAALIVKRIFTAGFANPGFPIVGLILCFSIWIYQFIYESRLRAVLEWTPLKIALMCLMIIYVIIFTGPSNEAFIYLQF